MPMGVSIVFLGLRSPPHTPPPSAMRVYQACELFAKAHGVGVVVVCVGGVVVVVDMQLWVTSNIMQLQWATYYKQSLRKKFENLAKITM